MNKSQKKILVFIFVLALALRLLSAFLVPIFEKPDEDRHFAYISFIAEHKELPVQTAEIRGEFYQPPLYYIFASLIMGIAKAFTQSKIHLVISMRLLSIIFSMLTLYVVYKISSLLFADRRLVLGIAAFLALLPSHINMSSTVTNANFSDFLSTLIVYIMLIILVKGQNNGRKILLLGIIVGVALATRLSTIPAVLTIPFALFTRHYPDIKKAIKPILAITLIALAISSANFLRNFFLYGDFLGTNAMRLDFEFEGNSILQPVFIARLLGWTFITFWASFGKTNGVFIGSLSSKPGIAIFAASYFILLLVTLASLYGLYTLLRRYRQKSDILTSLQKKSFFVLLVHLAILSATFIYFNKWDFQPQGRLFFPAISTISVFFTLGIYRLFSQNNRQKFLFMYMGFLILLNIASIASIMLHW